MKFKLITLFIILCLGFTSCSENETPEPRTTRTILVYMMANNSLNSFASKNIESMIEGATSKNLNGGNLIVYYAPAGSPPELLRIKEENGVVKKIHLKDYEKQNSADPDVTERDRRSGFTISGRQLRVGVMEPWDSLASFRLPE